MRPILAEAVELARRALLDLEPVGVGAHLGVTGEDESSATHHFEATLPGYGGWQWAVVVAAPPEATVATVSESALLPGPDALVAPDFIPWDQRIRPGDLAPGDLLAPPVGDTRLVPGYVASGDPAVDEVALEIGLGRTQVLSREGREDAADRWFTEYGPDTDMARAAPSTCGLCGFYVPLAGALRSAFGVCANAMGADGHVVHVAYGCGAHSDVVLPSGNGSPLYEAYDDAAVELIPVAELRPEAVAAEPESPVVEAEAPVEEPVEETAESGEAPVESAEAPAESEETAPAAAPEPVAEEGTAALFEVPDPDAVYDDAWAVSAVRVESDAVRVEPDSGAAESR
ncbi:hypothetical protein JMUB6875_65930 [Nocardia sp. JMUB6875]